MKRSATRTKPAMANADNFDASAMRKHSADAARLMRSLANRQRLLVLCAIAEGELSVSELNRRITLSQSALSQHLAVLRNEQLVSTRRDAQTIYYSLADGPAVRVLQLLHDEFCGTGEPKRRR
jgi:ArsR family transcriptional regulator, virulence genes transcriptional regulator